MRVRTHVFVYLQEKHSDLLLLPLQAHLLLAHH